ncbi:MAG: TPM domain-containing protein [Treponema sp.]|jgi:uncharacterized protein|nr:TPM domain-containing protein [Treponema sp.]
MKKLFPRAFFLFVFGCCLLPCLAAQSLPKPSGFVNDFAKVMKAQDADAVESLAATVKEKTGAELALVTVESYAPYATISDYSIALAEAWGVGERDKDNGIILVLAMTEREVRIEVGYGLEGAIPDSVAGRILDTVVIPAFQNDDFSGGLREGCRSIAAYVVKEKGLELADFDLPETLIRSSRSKSIFNIIIPLIFFLGFIFIPMLRFAILRSVLGTGSGAFRPGGFGSGSSFGSSGGGGFGGFGGGSFGGGGASRRF